MKEVQVTSPHAKWTPMAACLVLTLAFIAGCPTQNPPNGESAKLTLLFTADNFLAPGGELLTKARVVQGGEIESLVVRINAVELVPSGTGGGHPLSVLAAPFEVDLANLVGIAEVLDVSEIAAGDYSGVNLEISNPRLTLANDPATTITDVALLDGGAFTIAQELAFAEGDEASIMLDLGGISLSELEDGSYLLTPDFRVSQEEDIATVKVAGMVQDLDPESNTFTLHSGPLEVAVDYTDAVVFLSGDANEPTGSAQDIVDDAVVVVLGALTAGGDLIAEIIVIRSFDPSDHMHGQDYGGHQDHMFHDMLDTYGGHYDDEGRHMADFGDHHGGDDDMHADRGHGGGMM